MKYEIELSKQQQIAELSDMRDTVNRALHSPSRKRSLRPSELTMTVAKYKRAVTALSMAIDRLEETK